MYVSTDIHVNIKIYKLTVLREKKINHTFTSRKMLVFPSPLLAHLCVLPQGTAEPYVYRHS